MAILVNKIFRNGIEAKDAYAKIENNYGLLYPFIVKL